jgi:hypothetical protein
VTVTIVERIVAEIEEVGGGFVWLRLMGRRVKLKAASKDVEIQAAGHLYRNADVVYQDGVVTAVEPRARRTKLPTNAPKWRPLVCSAWSVRGIRNGTKTQTRRVVSPQPRPHLGLQSMWGTSPPPDPVAFGTPGLFRVVGADYPDDESDDRICPYGAPGDFLWVKETWWPRTGDKRLSEVLYRADSASAVDGIAWKSSRFMPRWASRLSLEITDVRAQRLQKITREDAWAEGIAKHHDGCALSRDHHKCAGCLDAVAKYRELWDELNAKRGFPWGANPWVYATTFRRVEPEAAHVS